MYSGRVKVYKVETMMRRRSKQRLKTQETFLQRTEKEVIVLQVRNFASGIEKIKTQFSPEFLL